MSNSIKGVVKWFNDAKGFGFIEHTSGRDVFVHYSVIESQGFKTLKDGEEVLYELEDGPKGLHAVKVQRVPGEDDEELLADHGSEDSQDDEDSDDEDSISTLSDIDDTEMVSN